MPMNCGFTILNQKGRSISRNKDPRGMGLDGLTVKGTTIQDFDEDSSIQKT